jgi:UPF0176 protein
MYTVAALYQFKLTPNYQDLQAPLKQICDAQNVKGTLLVAEEGINGTIAGSRDGIDVVVDHIRNVMGFDALEYKESFADTAPFYRMKVRLKKEIVTLGVPGTSPTKTVGEYVDPKAWNELLANPETVVVDTRNDYEYKIGTFKNALDPNTECFTQFPKYVAENLLDKKDKPIAMFCTGGIRCEKSTSYLKDLGFEKVYHLKGGILKYLEEVPEEESLWEGECYVFDQRVSVGHGLEVGHYGLCRGCRNPISDEDKLSPKYEDGVTCPTCFDVVDEKHKHRARERQRQTILAKQRNGQHIGDRIPPQRLPLKNTQTYC